MTLSNLTQLQSSLSLNRNLDQMTSTNSFQTELFSASMKYQCHKQVFKICYQPKNSSITKNFPSNFFSDSDMMFKHFAWISPYTKIPFPRIVPLHSKVQRLSWHGLYESQKKLTDKTVP